MYLGPLKTREQEFREELIRLIRNWEEVESRDNSIAFCAERVRFSKYYKRLFKQYMKENMIESEEVE